MSKTVIEPTVTLFLFLFAVVGTAVSSAGTRSQRAKSSAPSPVLTSVIELRTDSAEDGCISLYATGLTADGKRETLEESQDSQAMCEYHLKYMTDHLDGYWTECHRIILTVEGGNQYIVGYQEYDGDSDDDEDDVNFNDCVTVPLDFHFDVKTQKFVIHTDRLVPLPVRFRERKWTGHRFLVPLNLQGFSKDEMRLIIEARGGQVVGPEGPVDVVVLPNRVDFCPGHWGTRNRIAERWIRNGAKVLWERYLGHPNAQPVGRDDDEWRD
ncbi:MAG: hypothetical protein AB1646_20560 [Thermodesulfobacteriota bacterium]